MNGKANSSHTHDDRYYTESEINSKFNAVNNDLTSIKNGFALAQIANNTYNQILQIVNITTGDVFLYVYRKTYVQNGTAFAIINAYYPTSTTTITTFVQNDDGSFQNGEITVRTDGNILINAIDINKPIGGGAWIFYKYK